MSESPATVKALVLIAHGTEEMECVIICDVLRRAGIEVTLAGLNGSDAVTCSRHVKIHPDVAFKDAADLVFDVVALPGGAVGAKRFCDDADLHKVLRAQLAANRMVACLCAASTVLLAAGVGVGKAITSHPSVAAQLEATFAYKTDRVVVDCDGNLITSRGPGTSFEFALTIVERLCGKQKRTEVEAPMMLA
jgi:protein DJ-1